MNEKDMYDFQKARLTRLVADLAPGKQIEFDENSSFIRFRVFDPVTRTVLSEISGEWIPSEAADKSDDWWRNFIRRLSNGKI